MKKFTISLFALLTMTSYFVMARQYKSPITNDTNNTEKLDQNFKNKYALAEGYVASLEYDQAILLLKQLDSITPSNSNINYHLGLCYFNSANDKKAAISYFEKAVKNINIDYKSVYNETNAPCMAYYYLGKSYHSEYMFKEAVKSFEKYKTYLQKSETNTLKDIDRYIEICQNGIKLMNTDLNPQVQILNAEFNASKINYSISASSDNSVLIYSAVQNKTGKQEETASYYYTVLDGQKWTKPIKLDNNFSSIPDNVASKLFTKKNEIFITKNTNGVKELYSITYKNNKWSEPVKLGPAINSKASINNACVSPDGSTLYFSSNKEGGYGGYDIYSCERLSDGTWSKPVNLGVSVNTPYDDVSPFIAADGVTLYFSSQGHNTMGGFDVFFSTLSDEGLWSNAENIGYPINTPQDDMFYIPSSDEKKAFYSSTKNGEVGENDIYIVTFLK
jgi:tetratricopeptide (TPR) repeat protein